MFLPTPGDSDIMTRHTEYGIPRLSEDDFLNGFSTSTTFEAICVIGIAASGDCFVDDGFMAYATGKGTVGAKGVAVG